MEIEDAGQHRTVGLVECPAGVRLHYQEADFFRAVALLIARRLDPHQAEQGIGGAVEQPDEWRHESREHHQRCRNGFRGFFRTGERDGFWRQLAEHDVKEREEKEGDGNRRHVRSGRRRIQPDGAKELIEDVSQYRFANPPERKRGDGDSELSAGDVTIEMLKRRLDRLRTPVAPRDHLVQLAAPGGNERKLRGHEEPVDSYQSQNRNHAAGRHG